MTLSRSERDRLAADDERMEDMLVEQHLDRLAETCPASELPALMSEWTGLHTSGVGVGRTSTKGEL